MSITGLGVTLGTDATTVGTFAIGDRAILIVGAEIAEKRRDDPDRSGRRPIRRSDSCKIERERTIALSTIFQTFHVRSDIIKVMKLALKRKEGKNVVILTRCFFHTR